MSAIKLTIPSEILPLIFSFLTIYEHIIISKNICKLWNIVRALRRNINLANHFEQNIHNIINMGILNITFKNTFLTDNNLKLLLACKKIKKIQCLGSAHYHMITDIGLKYISHL